VTVAGCGVAVSVGKAGDADASAEGTTDAEGVGKAVGDLDGIGGAVGDAGIDVGLANAVGCPEPALGCAEPSANEIESLVASGATVARWHAASNEPSAPRLSPTNLRLDKPLPDSEVLSSLLAFSGSEPMLPPSHARPTVPITIAKLNQLPRSEPVTSRGSLAKPAPVSRS
jgi:hypothetical protein